MDERDFELLDILEKTKNITHAADLLYVTQSSLSKRITAIENELGVTLLIRSRQGIHFTPEGEEVLKYTTQAARQLTLMREALNISRSYVCGTLNAGISINYALYQLPDVLARYRKQYPHVNTHVITDQSRNIYMQIAQGLIDVAIIRGEYPWKEHKVLLDRENICAICSAKDKGKHLGEIPYIGRKTDMVFERETAQWMREHNIQPQQHGIFVDNITTCVEMVTRGLGWAIVPEICLNGFSGDIRPLTFANGESFVRSTYIMYTDTALSLPQAEAFINIVRNQENKGV